MTLDNRIKELIAVGASVTANCQSCLEYHVARALETGSDIGLIKEAIEVGKMVRRGAGSELDKLASRLTATSAAGAATGAGTAAATAAAGCGCGQ